MMSRQFARTAGASAVEDRLAAWGDAGVTNLIIAASDITTLTTIAEGVA